MGKRLGRETLVPIGISLVLIVAGIIYDAVPTPIKGKVEAREYMVVCLSEARLLEIRVEEGDYVKMGDTLAIVDSPDLKVKPRGKKGMERAPIAVMSRREKRKREREAFQVLRKAKAGLEEAEREWRRLRRLYEEGSATAQERDDAFADYKAMEAQVKAAQEIKSSIQETAYVSWMEGEVKAIYHNAGEKVDSGMVLVSIDVMSDIWGTFIIPKDRINGRDVGSRLEAWVPAFSTNIDMEIIDIQDADSIREGIEEERSYKRKVLEVKAKPLTELEDGKSLRPGMVLRIDK